MAGLLGAYTAGFLNDVMGICSLLWPIVFAFIGIAYLSVRYIMYWWRWCGLFLLTLCALILSSALDLSIGDLSGGGMAGNTLYKNGLHYLSPIGTFILWLFLFLIGLQLLFNFSWTSLFSQFWFWFSNKFLPQYINDKFTLLKQKLGPIRSYWPKKFPSIKPGFSFLSSFLSGFPLDKIFKKKEPVSQDLEIPEDNLSTQIHDPDIVIIPSNNYEKINNNKTHQKTIETAPELTNLADLEIGNTHDEVTPIQDINKDINYDESGEDEEYEIQPNPESGIKLFTEKAVIHPLPPTDLLLPPLPAAPASLEKLKTRGQDLMSCFNDFGIQGELVKITPGPVITMFEVRPAAGVRVVKISNLAEDLSLALKAVSVRIQPVPGSNTVGIEIPNDTREMVNFRELAESPDFRDSGGSLPIILGKTISGKPYSADLSKMPHLLVGGTTGAGKSVSLNAMLISLLYKHQPSDLKLLLIDPKRVEMSAYADLPHLVHPVVTEMEDAKSALEWAIHEMERRFDTIKRLGVRNVASYNQRLASYKDSLPPDFSDLQPIPYLVIVIDELADLMMTAAREVESSILRLLQLARAAAIHLILATQRPSVDVVTGLLKANLSCRVAFKVISRHDSRTILDQTGAEQLLGKGDMLFKPPAGALLRLHAPFLSDDEIQAVVNYWKNKENPVYDIDFSKWNSEKPSSSASGSDFSDNLYEEAKAFVMEQGRGSISLLQRHLKIGFNRSARIMEQMEKDGIITPADGSKPRTVIRN